MTGRTRLSIVGALASGLAVLSLASLTEDHAWVVPAALAIAIVAGLGLGLRRLGVPLPLVVLGQLVGLVLWLGVLVAGDVAWSSCSPTGSLPYCNMPHQYPSRGASCCCWSEAPG
jgi:hydrogenase/urease accessory protein HupE